jgi:hypothetical protein
VSEPTASGSGRSVMGRGRPGAVLRRLRHVVAGRRNGRRVFTPMTLARIISGHASREILRLGSGVALPQAKR